MNPEIRAAEGSEGGHWYIPGNPVQCAYEIKGANGKWRAPTIRDARKYGWVPGITTICRMAAQPGLERWKVRQGILSALTHPEIHQITDADQIIRMIELDSKEQAKQAALEGTAIHKAIEDFFSTRYVDAKYQPQILGVRETLMDLCGIDDPDAWQTEVACTHPLGFGSRVDLYSTTFGMVVDFKGKEFGPNDEVKGWPEQAQQLAAGREMILPGARCVNLFISRNNPGLVKAYEWSEKDLQKGWREFQALLEFWKVRNGIE